MIKYVFLAVFMLCSLNVFADTLISGTWRKGSNVTEPQPQKSKYLKTIVGGVAVTETRVSYVLDAEIYKPFKRAMFLRAEFENPEGEPFIEEAEVPAGQKGLRLVHGPVKGLQVHHSYWVKLSLYELKDRTNPVDVLTQNIKSYADTTGSEILVKTGLTDGKK
jgi:hypothetical protein